MMHLTQGLHRSLQQSPDAPMTIFAGRTRTFREVHDRVARLAGGLRALGVQSGDRVGVLALNADNYSESLLAVAWADAVINPQNIRWSTAEIAYALTDSGTEVLIVDDAFAGIAGQLVHDVASLRTIVHWGSGDAPDGSTSYDALIAQSEPVEDSRRGGDALAGLFYTGGTTGTPKGVMLTHANLVSSALGTTATGAFLTPGCRYLHAAPMFHLADLAAWLGQLVFGGTHVIVPKFDPVDVLRAIQDDGVTDVLLVPTMIQALVDDPRRGEFSTDGLRHIIYGASPIDEALLDRAMKAFPQVVFTQAYGMTELAPVATLLAPDDHVDSPTGPARLRSAGRAAPHAELLIADSDGTEVARGEVGEIIVRGPHVMAGYWNKPQETADALRGGWMHTGDAGWMDEAGYVFVVDRIKDMIITGGENVYSAEVENALCTHPSVAAAAVIGLPDDQWGERVHAVVVPAAGADVTADELIDHVRARSAGYKAPRGVTFIDALPLSGAGKVLKRELRATLAGESA
jgi:acyl-CoA synthetase (AMP-forming)/AMP-acid ligase II